MSGSCLHRGALVIAGGTAALAILIAAPADTASARAIPLRLSGSVGGLYPGVLKPMRVTLLNRSDRAVRLRLIRARALRGRPGCGSRNFIARARRGVLVVAAHRTRSTRMRVGLSARATDACQGATFRLRLIAQARRPGRRHPLAAWVEDRSIVKVDYKVPPPAGLDAVSLQAWCLFALGLVALWANRRPGSQREG